MKNNFVKVGLVVPKIKLGDSLSNAMEIVKIIEKDQKNAILVFPELTITGYSLGDWFFNREIIKNAELALKYIIEHNDHHTLIIGSILEFNSCLYDVAYVIQGKELIGIVPKFNLNSANENKIFVDGYDFYENTGEIYVLDKKVPMGKILFKTEDESLTFGVEVGSDNIDLPALNQELYYNGAEIVFNIASDSFNIKKNDYNLTIAKNASLLGNAAYVYTSTGVTETSSDVLYPGMQIVAVNGKEIINQNSLDSYNSKITYADIDLETIKYKRLQSKTKCGNNLGFRL